jgi:hypothetical protein
MNPQVRATTRATRVSVRIGPCYSSCGTSAARGGCPPAGRERGVLLAYMDDSGEQGTQLWAAVLIEDRAWLDTLDAWADYRRWLRNNFGLPIVKGRGKRVPVELHATDFITGAGDWRHLHVNQAARLRAFRVGLRMIGRHAAVFAVAWVPSRPMSAGYSSTFHVSPAIDCWRTLLERLATFSTVSAGGQQVLAILDEGYGDQVHKGASEDAPSPSRRIALRRCSKRASADARRRPGGAGFQAERFYPNGRPVRVCRPQRASAGRSGSGPVA